MALNVGAIYADVGAKFDDKGFDRFDRRLEGARREARKPVKANLRGDTDERGFREFNRDLDKARRTARRGVTAHAKVDYDRRGLDRYSNSVREADRHTRRLGVGSRLSHGGVALLGRGAATAAGFLGVAGLAGALKFVVTQTSEAQVATAKLRGVVSSMGGAVPATVAHVEKLTDAISRQTGADDEAVKGGLTILETFKGLQQEGGKSTEVFDRTAKAAAAVSLVFGQDLNKTSVMLGKALSEPAKGASALRRIGAVAASDVDALKKAAENGAPPIEQQRMLLDALEQQVKRVSPEYSKTLPAAMGRLKVAAGDLAEHYGNKLAPSIDKGSAATTKFLRQMETGRGTGGKFRKTIEDIAHGIGTVLGPLGKVVVGLGKFAHEHPAVAKLAGAVVGLGIAFRGIRLAGQISGVSRLAGGLRTLGNTRAGQRVRSELVGQLGNVWGRLRTGVTMAGSRIAETFGGAGRRGGGRARDGIVRGLESVWGRARGAVRKGASAVADTWARFGSSAGGGARKRIVDALTSVWGRARAGVRKAGDAMASTWSRFGRKAGDDAAGGISVSTGGKVEESAKRGKLRERMRSGGRLMGKALIAGVILAIPELVPAIEDALGIKSGKGAIGQYSGSGGWGELVKDIKDNLMHVLSHPFGREGGIITAGGFQRFAVGGTAGAPPMPVSAAARAASSLAAPDLSAGVGLAAGLDRDRNKAGRSLKGIRTDLSALAKDARAQGTRAGVGISAPLDEHTAKGRRSSRRFKRDVTDDLEDTRRGGSRSTQRLARTVSDRLDDIRQAGARQGTRFARVVEDRFSDARRAAGRHLDRIARAARVRLGDVTSAARRQGPAFAGSVRSSMGSADRGAYAGLSYIAQATNKALRSFDAKPISVSVPRPKGLRGGGLIPAAVSPGELVIEPDGSAAVVPGQRTAADSVFTFLREGAAVLTDHGQGLLARGASVMDAVRHQLPHFAAGGMVRVPGDRDLTGGRDKVNASIVNEVAGWLNRYKAEIGYAYDPGHGHKSPGHNVTGTATDVYPAPGRPWTGLFETGLRALVAKGKTVYYGTDGIGTPLADHGRGNHAHIEWSTGGRFAALASSIKRLIVGGDAGGARDLVQASLDKVRHVANRKLADALAAASPEGGAVMHGDGDVERIFAKVAKRLSTSKVATLALGEAGYDESGMRDLNYGTGSSQGALQLLASTAAGLGVSPHDEGAIASLFFTRGFAGRGGANALAAKGLPAHQVAQGVQGSATASGSNYAQFEGAARGWMRRYNLRGGGLVGRALQRFRAGGWVGGGGMFTKAGTRGIRKDNRIIRTLRTDIEDLGRDYDNKSRDFDLTEEEFVNEGTETVPPSLNQHAIAQRIGELDKLIAVRRKIALKWDRLVRYERKLEDVYNLAARRLRATIRRVDRRLRGLRKGKESRQERKIINALEGRQKKYRRALKGASGHAGDLHEALRSDVYDAQSAHIDLKELRLEREPLLGGGKGVELPEFTPPGTDGTGDGGGAFTPEQLAAAAAEQVAAFNASRASLFAGMGSNFVRAGDPLFGRGDDPAARAAGLRYFGAFGQVPNSRAFGGYGLAPVERADGLEGHPAGGGVSVTQHINFAGGPTDERLMPHIAAHEVMAAMR